MVLLPEALSLVQTPRRVTRSVFMEIQALKLLVTEQDLNEIIRKHLPDDQPLENLQIRVAPEGVYVTGEYPLLFRVGFETMWELEIQGGKLLARLAALKAMGLPATVFKSAVLKAIEEAVQKEDWLAFDADTIVVDVDRLLAGEGIRAKTNLNAVRCQAGALLIESVGS
jgi:hypothetical protein